MAENQTFTGDHHLVVPTTKSSSATTFSQLLFAADHDEDDDEKNHEILNYAVSGSCSSFAIENPPKMLCFATKKQDEQQPQLVFKSHLTCTDSSAPKKSDSKLKRRNGSNPEMVAIKEASKKIKPDAPCSAGHAKRKEKLGERITALQQLISPFGKTDTASVLHEAMGYIKFLQEQVQVLCSPYLQPATKGTREKGEKEEDLKSRGLCLIPVDCSLHLANCTVADFWSPAMAMGKKLRK